MKEKRKRKILVVLVLAMMLMLLPQRYAEASYTQAGVSAQLEQLINQYKGKYFTGSFAGGKQCYGFAHMIFNNLFSRGSKNVGSYADTAKWKFTSPASDITTIGILNPGYSMTDLENLLGKAAPGDYIQLRRRGKDTPHSLIVAGIDITSKTIRIFDSNSQAALLNACYTQTFQEFYNKNDGVSLYRYYDYYPKGPTYEEGKYRVSTSSGLPLILRAGAGSNYENKASIPNGTELVVTQVNGSWGYVNYNGSYGWVSLVYCTYIGAGEHTHSFTEFLFVEKDHPHYKCYKCSKCDEVFRNTSEPTIYDGCENGICKYTGLGDTFYARIIKADVQLPLKNTNPGVAVANVALGTETGGRDTIWKFVKQDNDAYVIYSCADGQCLDMDNGTAKPVRGQNLSLYEYGKGAHQQWYVTKAGIPWWSEDCYSFEPLSNTELAIDIYDNGSQAGDNAWIHTRNNTAAQKFNIEILDQGFTLKEPELLVFNGSSLKNTTIQWAAVDHAMSYDIDITDANGTAVVSEKNYTGTSYSKFLPVGSYKIKVTAKNTMYEDLKAESKTISITIKQESGDKVASILRNNKEYTLYDYGLTWEEAKAFCEENGGRLLEITSEQEQQIVEELLKSGTYDFYWLGLTDVETEGTFKWESGAALSYTNWSENEPNNAGEGEDYGTLYRSSGKWNDVTIQGGLESKTGIIMQKDYVPVTKVDLGYEQMYIPLGQTWNLWQGKITPSNATNGASENLTFTVSDETILKQMTDAKTVKAVKTGSTEVKATSQDGPFATAQITVFDIALQEKALELNIGDTATLTDSIAPETVTNVMTKKWSSSNPDIVSVDATTGELTALAQGESTITVSASCGGSEAASASCLVKVCVPAEGIALSQAEVTLSLGESKQMTLSYYPENCDRSDQEYWFSGDESVVTVDNSGNITAKGYGQTQIYVVAGKLRAMCYVTVQQELTGIQVKETSLQLTEGDETDITVEAIPSNATLPLLVLEAEDTSVLRVDNDVYRISALKAGTTSLHIQTADKKYTVDVSVTVDHKWNTEKSVLKEATIYGPGEKGITCSICGNDTVKEDSRETIPALTKVEIEQGISAIADGAYKNLTNLKEVVIPDSVQMIGKEAFYGCTGLTSITIPASVSIIGTDAFKNCSPDLVIRAPYGSQAEAYAKANGITFEGSGKQPESEAETTITIGNKKVQVGKDVTVDVNISKNTGIAGYSYDINYDQSAMTLKSVSAGDLLKNNGQISTNGDVVNWYASDNVNGDGTLMRLVFSVKADAKAATYPVSISMHDGKQNLVDENGTYVKANYAAGTIEVTSGLKGDFNEDGDITIADVVLLNRHVLGKALLSTAQLQYADISGDGDITIADVVLLNRHVLGKINLFGTAENTMNWKTQAQNVAESMKIYAESVAMDAGTTKDIPVYLTGNTGMAGFALTVKLPEGYTLNTMKAGDILGSGIFTANGNDCTWYAADNIAANGLLMTLNVTADQNTKSGKVIIMAKDGKENNVSDEMGNTVETVFGEGTITISSSIEPGCNGNHKGGTATCISKAICEVCGEAYGEVDPFHHAGNTEVRGAKNATAAEDGYTGDTYCKDCGAKLQSGTVIPATGSVKITIDDVTARIGAQIEVPVKISNNHGIAGMAVTVHLPEGVHLNEIVKGELLANGAFSTNESDCTWYSSENMAGDGTLMILKLTVGTGAVNGVISVEAKDGKENNIADEAGNTVPASFKNGTFTVETRTECEINGHKGGTATCAKKAICEVCGQEYGEYNPQNHAGAAEIRNAKPATEQEEGYTGDTYCTDCGTQIAAGTVIARIVPEEPTVPAGTVAKNTASNGVYKVLQDGKSVEFTKALSTKKTTVKIPNTITVNGVKCKVTRIAANAFKNNKKLVTVAIGSNVEVIGNNAFLNCKKLKKVTGMSGVRQIGNQAFRGCSALTAVTIPGKVEKIGKMAYEGCKKLKKITIKTSLLSNGSIGAKAFKGTPSKATVKVPAKQLKAYKKLLIAKGMSKKAAYKK